MSITKDDMEKMFQRCLAGKPEGVAAVCPITGRHFFDMRKHPDFGTVPVYGGPFDSYTIPVKQGDGTYRQEHYDWDLGGWGDSEGFDLEEDPVAETEANPHG